MSRNNRIDCFTAAEVKRRMSAAKRYLQRYRTQRVLFLAPNEASSLTTIYLNDYDCYDEYNYVSSVELSDELIREHVRCNRELFVDDSLYKMFSVNQYVDKYLVALKRFFSVTCFCLLDSDDSVTYKVVICLGSLHHAPKLYYRDRRNKFYIEKLVAYDDLF